MTQGTNQDVAGVYIDHRAVKTQENIGDKQGSQNNDGVPRE
jgi:hypothetical protein